MTAWDLAAVSFLVAPLKWRELHQKATTDSSETP